MSQSAVLSSGELLCRPTRSTRVRWRVFHFHSTGHSVLATGTGWTPAADLYETPDEIIVQMNLGGVDPAEVKIVFEGNMLHIRGQRQEFGECGMRCYHVMEIERGYFTRSFELPAAVDARSAEASFHSGLLVVRMVKARGGTTCGCYSADPSEDWA